MLKKLSLIVLISLLSQISWAGLVFNPSIAYMEQSIDDGTTSADAKLTMIDLKLGYILDMGLYFGGLYALQDHDLLADSSDAFFGPSVGYYNNGFFILGTYYIFGERDLTDGSGKFTNVDGLQIDVSYTLPITDTIRLGPQLTYHSYKFKELQAFSGTTEVDIQVDGLTPYFTLLFMF